MLGVEPSQHQARVGDRGPVTAPAVGARPWGPPPRPPPASPPRRPLPFRTKRGGGAPPPPAPGPPLARGGLPPVTRLASALVPPMSSVRRSDRPTAAPTRRAPT